MSGTPIHDLPGYFEIARVPADIPAEDFRRDYFSPEVPVVIEGAGRDWPALDRWDLDYLRDRLADEPSVRHIVLFLMLDREALAGDFEYPAFVRGLDDPQTVFPYRSNTRLWIHSRDNVSAWHFDAGVVNNFNTQIVGRKEWTLVSPQTPPDCYPFSNFVVLDDERRILKDRICTRFVTRPGDMLYLPPLWFHTVRALDDSNINLMWVFTKRRTHVVSPALSRDLQRYRMHRYLSRHRFEPLRRLYARAVDSLPGYLKITWHFDELIDTGIRHSHRDTLGWFLGELRMLGRTLVTLPRIRHQIGRSGRAPHLSGATADR